MTRYRAVLAVGILAMLATAASQAIAGPATEQMRPAIERVIRIVQDPALKGPGRAAARRDAIRAVTDDVFAWDEMARRALGRHWNERTPREREQFVAAFTDLLERSYVSKIESYGGEPVVFAGEEIENDRATVRTQVVTPQSQRIGIDYRMLRQNGRWLVYDVMVENVGLIANYRAQFDKILARSSYEELLKRMRGEG